MKLHAILVNPPYPTERLQHLPFIPLGLGYLAAVLEKNQYEVDVIDCQALKLSYEDFKKEIARRQPHVVGMTSTTRTYNSALKIAKITKEVHPDCLTVLGGPHATFWDENALQECPQLDIVVRKEGEYTLLELMQKLEKGKSYHNVLGTTCRKDGKVVKNPDRPYIENLDELPFPARHLWPIERIRKYEDVFYLISSRGCPYWCEFCAAVRMFGRKYRVRSPKNVVDEIEFLCNTYGAQQFSFCDDVFTADQNRTEEICKEIKKRGLKIEWGCGTRVDLVSKELLIKMKEAGCVSVWFGVETGLQEVLDEMNKGILIAQTERAFGWLKELGLKPVPNILLGFPGETKETAWRTIKFAEKISPEEVSLYNIATPLPGTPLYNLVKQKGWLRVTDFDEYDCASPIFETPTFSMQDQRRIYEQAFQSFYLRPTYVIRMFSKGYTHGISASRKALSHLIKAIRSGSLIEIMRAKLLY